jgi:hypothetical protein
MLASLNRPHWGPESSPWTRCVDIQSLDFIPRPAPVTALLEQMIQSPDDAEEVELDLAKLSLDNVPETALVTLAGILLEYPIAYVVSPNVHAYLAKVPLDVYECILNPWESQYGRQYTWLKFSCPAVLGERDSFWSPRNVVEELLSRFQTRLAKHWLDDATWDAEGFAPCIKGGRYASTYIEHTLVTLDRVAL